MSRCGRIAGRMGGQRSAGGLIQPACVGAHVNHGRLRKPAAGQSAQTGKGIAHRGNAAALPTCADGVSVKGHAARPDLAAPGTLGTCPVRRRMTAGPACKAALSWRIAASASPNAGTTPPKTPVPTGKTAISSGITTISSGIATILPAFSAAPCAIPTLLLADRRAQNAGSVCSGPGNVPPVLRSSP